jgi:hypothetical protein
MAGATVSGMAENNDIITSPTPARKPSTAANDLPDAGETPKVLDALRAELTRKVKRQDVYLEVPERPNMLIRFSPNLTQHQIRAWRRNSGEETKAGLDTVKFSCYVLANTCTGISINNEMVVNENGEELVFGDDAIINMLSVNTVSEAIKAIFVVEPHVESAALAVMEAAGFNDSVEQVDPTKTP